MSARLAAIQIPGYQRTSTLRHLGVLSAFLLRGVAYSISAAILPLSRWYDRAYQRTLMRVSDVATATYTQFYGVTTREFAINGGHLGYRRF
uniref:DUF1206 domain-containing protein n=1 Tax=Macrostomum lignano TaxID=282301 RepID=A0A1I8FCU2_9PLAT